jgi:hypothetical protein
VTPPPGKKPSVAEKLPAASEWTTLLTDRPLRKEWHVGYNPTKAETPFEMHMVDGEPVIRSTGVVASIMPARNRAPSANYHLRFQYRYVSGGQYLIVVMHDVHNIGGMNFNIADRKINAYNIGPWVRGFYRAEWADGRWVRRGERIPRPSTLDLSERPVADDPEWRTCDIYAHGPVVVGRFVEKNREYAGAITDIDDTTEGQEAVKVLEGSIHFRVRGSIVEIRRVQTRPIDAIPEEFREWVKPTGK